MHLTGSDVQDVLAAEDRRYRAMQDGDLATLDELCADALSYAHSSGTRDTKSEYLGKIGSGYYAYRRIDHPVERVEVVGDTAIVVGRMTSDVEVQGASRRSTTWPSRSGPGSRAAGGYWRTRRRPCRAEPAPQACALQHEVVARLEPGLVDRAAVGRLARLPLLEPDDELLLGAEDDVAVEVVGALLEQVGDQRLVAGHVDQEVHVRRAEVADLGLRDQVADRAVHRDRVALRRDGAHAVAAVLAGRVLGAQPRLVDVGELRLVGALGVGLPDVEHAAGDRVARRGRARCRGGTAACRAGPRTCRRRSRAPASPRCGTGPSTVAGVAAGSSRWFIWTTSIDRPRTSEARMNSSRFSSLICPARVSHWIAAIHSASVSRTSRAKSCRWRTSAVISSASPRVARGGPALDGELGDVVLGDQLHGILLAGSGRRGPPGRSMGQGVSTSRTPADPVAWRRQASATSANGTTSCATAIRPRAACSATAVSASRRCPGLSALLV